MIWRGALWLLLFWPPVMTLDRAELPAQAPVLLPSPVPTPFPSRPLPTALSPRAGWLTIPRLGLSLPVSGWRPADCLERHRPPDGRVVRWSCASNPWLLAHNPGLFTSLFALRRGDRVYYGLDPYRVAGIKVIAWDEDRDPVPLEALVLQTSVDSASRKVLLVTCLPR